MKKKTNKTILLPLIAICLLLTVSAPTINIPKGNTTQIMPLDDKNPIKETINNN